ncbi:hypothetical protein [Nocardia wallacei]|uniref:hypothetical protein n=1 Tax=Nocardia wallacei TaxID=480035 RepID=UPI002453B587|nr:hypothetical protein [Nocardia wallacei]
MDDVLLTDRPTGSIADSTLPPYGLFTPAPPPSGDAVAFADANDRLVRHLFDVGLQLHTLRALSGGSESATTVLLDDLDGMIRDAGLAMLAMTMAH